VNVLSPLPITSGSVRIEIEQVENGFIVDVHYPLDRLPRPHNPMATFFKKGLSEEGNPVDAKKMMEAVMGAVGEIENPPKPIRKPHERYVFPSLDSVIKIAREVFEEGKDGS
jgi:hypothetical protein